MLEKFIPIPEFEDEIAIDAPAQVVWESLRDFAKRRRWDRQLRRMEPEEGGTERYILTRWIPVLGTIVSVLSIHELGEFHETAVQKPRWLRGWSYSGRVESLRDTSIVRLIMSVDGTPLFLRRTWGAMFTDATARALVLLKHRCENDWQATGKGNRNR